MRSGGDMSTVGVMVARRSRCSSSWRACIRCTAASTMPWQLVVACCLSGAAVRGEVREMCRAGSPPLASTRPGRTPQTRASQCGHTSRAMRGAVALLLLLLLRCWGSPCRGTVHLDSGPPSEAHAGRTRSIMGLSTGKGAVLLFVGIVAALSRRVASRVLCWVRVGDAVCEPRVRGEPLCGVFCVLSAKCSASRVCVATVVRRLQGQRKVQMRPDSWVRDDSCVRAKPGRKEQRGPSCIPRRPSVRPSVRPVRPTQSPPLHHLPSASSSFCSVGLRPAASS